MATTLTVLLAGVNKTSPVVKQVQKDIEKLGGTVSVFNKKQQRETKETTQGFEKVAHVLKGFGGVAREAAEGGGLLGRALGLFGIEGVAGLAVTGIGRIHLARWLAEGYADTAPALPQHVRGERLYRGIDRTYRRGGREARGRRRKRRKAALF